MIETMIRELISKAVLKLVPDYAEIITLSTPQLQFGDFSSNVALVLAKKLKKNPLQLAEEIVKNIDTHESIESIQVLKPGFIKGKSLLNHKTLKTVSR